MTVTLAGPTHSSAEAPKSSKRLDGRQGGQQCPLGAEPIHPHHGPTAVPKAVSFLPDLPSSRWHPIPCSAFSPFIPPLPSHWLHDFMSWPQMPSAPPAFSWTRALPCGEDRQTEQHDRPQAATTTAYQRPPQGQTGCKGQNPTTAYFAWSPSCDGRGPGRHRAPAGPAKGRQCPPSILSPTAVTRSQPAKASFVPSAHAGVKLFKEIINQSMGKWIYGAGRDTGDAETLLIPSWECEAVRRAGCQGETQSQGMLW